MQLLSEFFGMRRCFETEGNRQKTDVDYGFLTYFPNGKNHSTKTTRHLSKSITSELIRAVFKDENNQKPL